MWLKLCDTFWAHKKTLECSNAALGVWVKALTYCGAKQDPVFSYRTAVDTFGARVSTINQLVAAGFWEEMRGPVEGGKRSRTLYRVHDFEVYNHVSSGGNHAKSRCENVPTESKSRCENVPSRCENVPTETVSRYKSRYKNAPTLDDNPETCGKPSTVQVNPVENSIVENGDTRGRARTHPEPHISISRGKEKVKSAREQQTPLPPNFPHEQNPTPDTWSTPEHPRCAKHAGLPDDRVPPCRQCAEVREWFEEIPKREAAERIQATRAAIDACGLCDENGLVEITRNGRPALAHCTHQPPN